MGERRVILHGPLEVSMKYVASIKISDISLNARPRALK
jgi:hypothetical protein